MREHNPRASVALHRSSQIFRARLLTVLLYQETITQELVDMLMSWNHNSGFNVHAKGRIEGSDGNGIENIARACPVLDTGYMSRVAISVERVEFNPDDGTVSVYERRDRSPS